MIMTDKQEALKWTKKALKLLNKDDKHDSQAMWYLNTAKNYFDRPNGITMENLFETFDISYWENAIDVLYDYIEDDSKNKSHVAKNKAMIKHMEDSSHKTEFVILINPTYPLKAKVYPLKHKTILNLAKIMRKSIYRPVYIYQAISKAPDLNGDDKYFNLDTGLRGLINYALEHNKTDVLKKSHLVETHQVAKLAPLLSKPTRDRVNKSLSSLGNLDVVKALGNGTDHLKIVAPTTKDVDNVVSELV